jgi:hypothetical protein
MHEDIAADSGAFAAGSLRNDRDPVCSTQGEDDIRACRTRRLLDMGSAVNARSAGLRSTTKERCSSISSMPKPTVCCGEGGPKAASTASSTIQRWMEQRIDEAVARIIRELPNGL